MIKYETMCTNCEKKFIDDYDLKVMHDKFDNEITQCCPKCETDNYLMDLSTQA